MTIEAESHSWGTKVGVFFWAFVDTESPSSFQSGKPNMHLPEQQGEVERTAPPRKPMCALRYPVLTDSSIDCYLEFDRLVNGEEDKLWGLKRATTLFPSPAPLLNGDTKAATGSEGYCVWIRSPVVW